MAVADANGDVTVDDNGVGVILPESEIATGEGLVGKTGVGPSTGRGMMAQLDVPVEEVETISVVLLEDEIDELDVWLMVEAGDVLVVPEVLHV